MKYMGSKRWMLQNGLGDLIAQEVPNAARFVDLFAGAGAVSVHVSSKYEIPVVAYDLQAYSRVLVAAVIERESELQIDAVWRNWYARARALRQTVRPPSALVVNQATVRHHRKWSSKQEWTVTKAYGGHYFSSLQAVWLDALRQTLPGREPSKTVALAALLSAAIKCAAAPGHTAQPFQPTQSARPFLTEAWQREVVTHCKNALFQISEQHAKVRGSARVADANEAAASIGSRDLVFVDPPYSGVQYSRFYHVLETIAHGQCGPVEGIGRYPAISERPQSAFCNKSESREALEALLTTLARTGATVILTFPAGNCSNGLSGRSVTKCVSTRFAIRKRVVKSRFSTLGGNNSLRKARRSRKELLLLLQPKQGLSDRRETS